MSGYIGKRTTRRTKQDELVKGGLTPTLQKRERSPELAPGEIIRHASSKPDLNAGASSDSTSRPLMTQPALQLPRWEVTPGVLGIYNHGNTCFMNTIIQCLSNTDLVSEYFVQKKYKELINVKGIAKRLVGNLKADVADSLGNLLESLWSGDYTPDISNHFKSIVSKYNSQYKGSSQHDAQEFLSWLLQRLNEELYHNLHSTKKKGKDVSSKSKKDKHAELPMDSNPETVMAAHQGFEVYNRFQALYRSSLTCPNCGEHSNTYEPYAFLSLPVPHKTLRPVYITVVYLDDNPKQLKIALEMNILDSVRDLREKLAYELEVPPKRLVLCQIFDNGFRNTYSDEQHLSDIHESEMVYVFETYPFSEINKTQTSFETIQILLVHIEKVSTTKSYRFSTPQVIRVQRDVGYIELQRVILKSMGLAVSEDVVEESKNYECAIFKIRVIDSGVTDVCLPCDVEMPLYTQPIDRALSTYSESDCFGPPHVKFVVEWDPSMKNRVVEDDEDVFEEHQSVHKVRLNQQQPSHVSLEDCLRLFTQDEKLGKEELWNCPHCEKVQPCKKLGLISLPDILVIHLKRFGHCGVRRNKLNILVNFPVNNLEMGHHVLQKDKLEVKDWSPGQPLSDLYDLYAVSNHFGNMNGGHYTAFCRNPIDNHWYEFDDTIVKPLKQQDIVSRAAYLLFYQRKKVTNDTRDKLLSGSHWVFDIYGLPPITCDKPGVDDLDGYIDRIKIHHDYDSDHPRSYRAKSEPVDRRPDTHVDEDYLRREMNSPRQDDRPSQLSSQRQRPDGAFKESPRKELYVNMDQAPSVNKSKSSDPTAKNYERVSVAEQILKSKSHMSEPVDGFRTCPVRDVDHATSYRRQDSVDSRNSHSYTSSGDASQGSLPPSPNDDHGTKTVRTSNQNAVNSAKSVHKDSGNLLNNERDLSGPHSGLLNGVKLKYSNQINSDGKYRKEEVRHDKHESVSHTAKVSNTKLINTPVSNINSTNDIPPPIPARRDVFSTPQQGRKSPAGPVQNGRGPWSTPQPQRKQYNNDNMSRPPMDRQSSVPISRARPQSSYDTRGLEVEGHSVFEDQPRSMPTSSKPPLPKSSQTMGRPSTSRGNGSVLNTQYDKKDRPQSASVNRVSGNADSQTYNAGEQSRVENHMHSRRSDVSDVRYPRDPTRMDYRDQNHLSERQDAHRRSMHVKSDRPLSYHQPTYNDYYDQYYLSQPVEDYSIARSNRYATMRPVRPDTLFNKYSEEDVQYLSRQLADQQYSSDLNQIHQPRSRVPVSYNPQRYQDSHMPRYQPHLHEAKMLTRMALQERENQKMKSHYLKESSV